MRQASAANVARAKVFEVSMNTRGPLVLASAIPGASYDVVAVEAHSCQLFFEDPADVCPFLVGQWMMSASMQVLEIGGEALISQLLT